MEMNENQVEAIVRQVLNNLSGTSASGNASSAAGGSIPKTAHVAMLTSLEHFETRRHSHAGRWGTTISS